MSDAKTLTMKPETLFLLKVQDFTAQVGKNIQPIILRNPFNGKIIFVQSPAAFVR